MNTDNNRSKNCQNTLLCSITIIYDVTHYNGR